MLASLLQVAPEDLQTPDVEWRGLMPLFMLLGGALVILLLSSLMRRKPFPGLWALLTIISAGAAIGTSVPLWNEVTGPDREFSTLNFAVGIDGSSVFLTIVICAAVIITALLADGYLRRERLEGAELYVLLLLSASGGIVMATALDLIVMFLGLEILSIAVYVLAAMHLRRIESQEAGMKYFILGAFASAFFLYGIALVYGARGSTNLVVIFQNGFNPESGAPLETPALLLAGIALILVGFGFKVSAAPFHAWAPDVYQGSPSPIVSFMASGVKVAGFAGLMRVFFVAFQEQSVAEDWRPFVYVLAVATLLVGSVLAVVQTDVKRMLAYSSIAHAGFVLVGVQAFNRSGVKGALFYLAAYTFMVAGSFGVVTVLSRRGDAHTSLDDLKGLSRREPLLAFVFAVFLFAQAGVPLTSGFFAKFYVLGAAIEADSWPLAITAMVSAVIAAFLYLRITVSMYMGEDEAEQAAPPGPRTRIPIGAKLALAACFIVTLVAGFFPDTIANPSRDAIEGRSGTTSAQP